MLQLPSEFKSSGALEYFKIYKSGRYNDDAQYWFILPVEKLYIDPICHGLVIGNSGAGELFCFRPGHTGLWAFHPIGEEWQKISGTLAEFEKGWVDGTIRV